MQRDIKKRAAVAEALSGTNTSETSKLGSDIVFPVFPLFNILSHYGDIRQMLIIILSMFDNDNIIALIQLRYTRKCIMH